MIRCTRCNRKLKAPTASGMGETCERHVLGTKPKRKAKPVKVSHDDATLDLFNGYGWPWMVAA